MRPFHLGIAVLLLGLVVAWLWLGLGQSGGFAFAARSVRARAAESGFDAADGTDVAASAKARVALAPIAPALSTAHAARKTWDRPRVAGRVVDPAGNGVAGARVFAATGSGWLAIPLDLEPEGLPRAWIRVERSATDAEGRFVLEDLRAGELRLAVRAPGFAPRTVERLELPDVAELRLDDVRLEAGVVLEGHVVDLDGRGVAGADLLVALDAASPAAGAGITLPGHGIPLARADDDGSFRIDELAPGPWRILVDAPDFATSEEEGRTERAGERRSGLVFRLERGFEIHGRVRGDVESRELAGLRVSARPSPEREAERESGREPGAIAAEETLPDASDARSRTASCEKDGAFVLRGVRANVRYLLAVTESGDDAGEWKRASGGDPVYAWAGQRGVEIAYAPGAALRFRVLDDRTGAPIQALTARAGVGDEGESPLDARGEVRRSYPEGRVRIGDLRPRRDSADVVLRVAATGYKDLQRKGIALAPGEEKDLGDLRLEPEHVVSVHVVDGTSGADVENARVLLGGSDEEIVDRLRSTPDTDYFADAEMRYARTDAAGRARLSSLPGQRVAARADARGFLPSEPWAAVLPEDGDVEVELRLRRGGLVEVRVRDERGSPVEGVAIEHKRPGPDEESGDEEGRRTDAAGVARYEALPAGAHAFRLGEGISAASEQETEGTGGWIETVASEGSRATLDFRAPPRGGLVGVVREGGRPLASARLHLSELHGQGETDDPGWFAPGASDPFSTSADQDGGYAFAGLRCARYRLFVTHAGRRMTSAFEVSVENPPRTFDVELDVASLEGRVTGPDGSPIPDVHVVAASAAGDDDPGESYRMVLFEDDRGAPRLDYRPEAKPGATTDANGRFSLRGVRSGDALNLYANGDFVRPGAVENLVLGPDEARRGVDLVLAPAGVLEVSLAGSPGSRRDPRRLVRAVRAGDEQREDAVSTGHLRGRNRSCRLVALEPGTYHVALGTEGNAPEGNAETASALAQDVEVVAGRTTKLVFQAR
jgi:protocatechuate 3,4-dioxygenase beta subunit